MIKLTDFNKICRLCLTKDDEHLVDLFSKLSIPENKEENDDIFLAEIVESFCTIEIKKDDGLPSKICTHCLSSMTSLHKLRIVSVKSNRLLYDIVHTQHSHPVDAKRDLQSEFIDISSTPTVKKDSLGETEIETNFLFDDLTPPERSCKTDELNDSEVNKFKSKTRKIGGKTSPQQSCKTELSDPEVKKLKSKKRKIGRKIRKVSCEMCGKMVPLHFIEFHLNLHRDIRPYKCEVEDCNKYFVAPNHAKNHYTKVHLYGVIRPFKCDICGKGFTQKSSLSTHKTYHFDPQMPCSICGQFYRNKRALKKHLLVHSGERKFPCSECKKSFQTNSTLRVHMRVHTLEKPYSCTECTKTFAYKCLLKGHTEKHHAKLIPLS